MKVHDFAELPLALAALISLVASAAGGQEKNETRYVVGRNPIVSITNKYGPVTVKPSENRQVVVGTTTPCVTLNAPTGLSSTVTSTTVVLSWSAPAAGCAPTTYIIQAGSTVGASNLANFSTGSTATTFTATGVAAGTYYVRVAAAIPGTLSAPSNEITLTVGPTQPQTVFASFQLFDPSTTGGPVTECRLRAPNNGSRLTCELRASAFTLGTAAISSYSWLVRYTHGTPVEISRTDANPSLSFSDVCDAPDGVNGEAAP